MKEVIENHNNAMEHTIWKLWKYIVSVVRKKAGIKNPSGRRIKKIDYCLYQTAIFSKTNLYLNYI